MTGLRLDTFLGEDLRSFDANELVRLVHAVMRDVFATFQDLCLRIFAYHS